MYFFCNSTLTVLLTVNYIVFIFCLLIVVGVNNNYNVNNVK